MNTPISALLERKGSAVVYTVAPTITVAEAVAEMNRHHIGAVVVCEGGKLTGMFTERDVLRRVVGAGVDPTRTWVAEVMTRGIITVSSDTTIEDTMIIFAERRCRHLPVLADGLLIGLISIGDISRWVADSARVEADHLKNYIAGGFPA